MEEIKLYNLQETAEILGVTPRTLSNYIKRGAIQCRKIGRGWKFTEEGIMNFVNGEKQKKKQ